MRKFLNREITTTGELEKAITRKDQLVVIFRCPSDTPLLTGARRQYLLADTLEDDTRIAAFIKELKTMVKGDVDIVAVSPCGILPHGQTMVKNMRFQGEGNVRK